MPQGTELLLGWKGLKNINTALKNFNIKELDLDKEDWEDDWENNDLFTNQNITSQLENAFLRSIKKYGLIFKNKSDHYYIINTPKGDRELTGFNFSLEYDPDEMGDDENTITFGIHMSGRYFPTYVDWIDEHGTLYYIDLEDALNMIKIAKKELIKEFPYVINAKVHLKEIWY